MKGEDWEMKEARKCIVIVNKILIGCYVGRCLSFRHILVISLFDSKITSEKNTMVHVALLIFKSRHPRTTYLHTRT